MKLSELLSTLEQDELIEILEEKREDYSYDRCPFYGRYSTYPHKTAAGKKLAKREIKKITVYFDQLRIYIL